MFGYQDCQEALYSHDVDDAIAKHRFVSIPPEIICEAGANFPDEELAVASEG